MPFSSYSTNPALNTTISGIYIGEDAERADMNDALRQLMADCARAWGIYDLGTLGSGVIGDLVTSRTFSGAGDGTSGLYGVNHQVTTHGANSINSVRTNYFGVNLNGTAGTVTDATGTHQFVWLAGSNNATNITGVESHLRVDGPGTVTSQGRFYNTAGLTVGGAVTIPLIVGYNAGQLSDTSAGGVVTTAIGFNAEHTQGGSATRGFRSQIRNTGSNSYSFLADTNDGSETAAAAFSGKMSVGGNTQGSATAPAYQLDVTANANDFSAAIRNRAGSNTFGLRIQYTAAAPNGTGNEFIRCDDVGTTRFAVASNGSVKINGTQVVANRQTGTAANASDLATAITLVNDLKAKLIAHGLIS